MSLIPNGLAKSAAGGFYDHEIEQSLRFNDDDSAYLSWTPASYSNGTEGTISVWIKRGNLGSTQQIFAGRTGAGAQYSLFYLNSTDQLQILDNQGASLITSAVYRDCSAWYHVILSYDTTQATASNRVKIYVNGVEQSITGTYPTQNAVLSFNYVSINQNIGSQEGSSNQYFDGYMAEFYSIDGTALDASSFGETKSGVWIPKAYEGSYGTNGFYLPLTSDANDDSGNGNNFTANNLASTDYVLDSPTNNFATLNPLDKGGSANYYEGNLKYSAPSGVWTDTRASLGMSSGKWYWETNILSLASFRPFIGIINTAARLASNGGSATEQLGVTTNSYAFWTAAGFIKHNGANTSYSTPSVGDIVQIALDMDDGKIWFGINNSWYNSGSPSTGTNATYSGITLTEVAAAYEAYNTTDVIVANFGQDSSFAGNKTAQGNTDANGYGDFYYAPPSGYLALCTANLEVPDAMNPALDASPQDYFNTLLWTGDDTNNRSITGLGFNPDLTWIKSRSNAYGHGWFDNVRGTALGIMSQSTNAEADFGSTLGWTNTGCGTDGIVVDRGSNASINGSGSTYVAWNWKANGSGVSNTDGSITSTVSANTDAGFSIVSYAGTASQSTVGHGLSQAPQFIVTKNRDYSGDSWITGSDFYTSWQYYGALNDTGGQWNGGTSIYVTAPTSSVFTVGTDRAVNSSGYDYISYCFHSVEGFSKFGSYTGNGSTDGPFVYTGFKPAFVIIKNYGAAGYSWVTLDNKRDPDNLVTQVLYPNISNAEADGTTYASVDFLSNGFKLRNNSVWSNNGSYIYMAFAEMPTKFCASMAR